MEATTGRDISVGGPDLAARAIAASWALPVEARDTSPVRKDRSAPHLRSGATRRTGATSRFRGVACGAPAPDPAVSPLEAVEFDFSERI
jgi:hypothetical protein